MGPGTLSGRVSLSDRSRSPFGLYRGSEAYGDARAPRGRPPSMDPPWIRHGRQRGRTDNAPGPHRSGARRGKLARGGGLEPPITGPEPAVLPITPPPNGG